MRKFLVVTIPIIAIILFVLIMVSSNYLKRPFGNDDNIPKSIEQIIETINREQWDEVSREAEELDLAWKKVIKRVQFSSERDEINSLSMNIARLHGAIMAKDRGMALVELREAYEHWEELGK